MGLFSPFTIALDMGHLNNFQVLSMDRYGLLVECPNFTFKGRK